MSHFRITSSPHGTLLYPVPVDKERTYLLVAKSPGEAKLLKHLLDPGYLRDPLTWPEVYEDAGRHVDEQTPRFTVNWSALRLEFLPNRGLDLTRAEILEGLMARKIAALATGKDPVSVDDLIFRFRKQQECAECEKLGINAPELEAWFLGFRDL
jgi:hypothetical protein